MVKSHYHHFVHPAYQRLARRARKAEKDAQAQPKNNQTKQNKASFGVCQLAVRIKQRLLNYSPLARVPPFYCQKCGLASNKMMVLTNHVCSKKLVAFSEYTNLEKLVRLGFRSKVKDAFAVLERIPNPQSVKIHRLPSSLHFHVLDKLKSPPTLIELASKAFDSAHLHFETVVPVCLLSSSAPQTSQNGQLAKQEAYSEDTAGYFCQVCCKLFCRFLDYDQHLEENEDCAKLADPLEIEVATTKPYSRLGHLIENKDIAQMSYQTDDQDSRQQPQQMRYSPEDRAKCVEWFIEEEKARVPVSKKIQMTRTRSSNSRCGDVVRYVIGASSSSAADKFYESYNDVNIFLDFEHVRPTDSERFLFQLLDQILTVADRLEQDIAEYGAGASAQVREALQNPADANVQHSAMHVVRQFVLRIKSYYDLAQQIEQAWPNLLWNCAPLARVVDFVFRFDSLKMSTPALQNDFSFYRRVISKNDCDREEVVKPTPMLNSISNATVVFVKNHPDLPVSNTTETLATIVHICRHMLERKDFCERISLETRDFFLRVMVGSLILFDHIDTEGGAFCRQSPIDVKAVVDLIKQNANEEQTGQLMNALRYTSKHFSDQETQKSIRCLFN
uniref:CYRIA/CYRIB Rac1 binding domain-containing protein n=1 Tax=Ditylenchus dipsaci TaxID=166011 RepID=A0A915D5Z9_9BILA